MSNWSGVSFLFRGGSNLAAAGSPASASTAQRLGCRASRFAATNGGPMNRQRLSRITARFSAALILILLAASEILSVKRSEASLPKAELLMAQLYALGIGLVLSAR